MAALILSGLGLLALYLAFRLAIHVVFHPLTALMEAAMLFGALCWLLA